MFNFLKKKKKIKEENHHENDDKGISMAEMQYFPTYAVYINGIISHLSPIPGSFFDSGSFETTPNAMRKSLIKILSYNLRLITVKDFQERVEIYINENDVKSVFFINFNKDLIDLISKAEDLKMNEKEIKEEIKKLISSL